MVKYVYLKPGVQISKASEEEKKKKGEISQPKNPKDVWLNEHWRY